MPPEDDADAWARFLDEHKVEDAALNRLYIITRENQAVGFISLVNHGVPEIYQIGYGVDEAHHGRGLATHCVRASVASLFGATRCQRLQATVEPDNHASKRVLEKCGFQREGYLRRGVKLAGALVDVELYAIVKPERSDPRALTQEL